MKWMSWSWHRQKRALERASRRLNLAFRVGLLALGAAIALVLK